MWVEIDLGKGYRSLFIFECKNWEAKVGKNEIIVFSEKIDALQATCGFFVARSFTGDAEAQAKNDPRIRLLLATQIQDQPVPFGFHVLTRDRVHADVEVYYKAAAHEEPKAGPIEAAEAACRLDGENFDLTNYVRDWATKVADGRLNTFGSAELPSGEYELDAEATRQFNPGSMSINEMDVASIKVRVRVWARIIRPAVLSCFDVATRGRALALESVEPTEGVKLQVVFTKTS